LGPVGGALLGLVVVPVAIAQYPDFFNANQWLLPVSVVAVIFCWVTPLFLHERAQRAYRFIGSLGGGEKAVTIVGCVAVLLLFTFACVRLLGFHERHLKEVLKRNSHPPSVSANGIAPSAPLGPSAPLVASRPKPTPKPTPQAAVQQVTTSSLTPLTMLSDGQRFVLKEKLSTYSGEKVLLVFIGNDPQLAVAYEQLISVFKDSGWTIEKQQIGQIGLSGYNFPNGPYLTGPNIAAPVLTTVFSIFSGAGVDLPLKPDAWTGLDQAPDVVIVIH
jgi:hypothetical protein